MGNLGRSSEGHRLTVEWIKDGAIGTVRESTRGAAVPEVEQPWPPGEGPAVKPAGFNWDLWLGPRDDRPYSGKVTPFVWRYVWDFGNGTMCDMSPHHFDPAFNALGLDAPETVEARASIVDPKIAPGSNQVIYHFPARGDRAALTAFWYNGGLRPPTPPGIDPDDPRQRLGDGQDGLMMVGDKGVLTCAGWSGMPRLLPLELHRLYVRPAKTLPRVAGHHADWLQACKGGTPACSNFEYGARLTEFVLLSTVALRTGKILKWDAVAGKATNVPQADAFLGGTYRKGWELAV